MGTFIWLANKISLFIVLIKIKKWSIKLYNNFETTASKIQVSSIFPRCASIQGGTALTLTVPNLDDKTATTLSHLTVGFQAKQFKMGDLMREHLGAFVKLNKFIISNFSTFRLKQILEVMEPHLWPL